MSQSIKLGLALGLTTMGRWRGEASMYLYPQLVLPVLPEWDRVTYPYAYILFYDLDDSFKLAVTSARLVGNSGWLRGEDYDSDKAGGFYEYILTDGSWGDGAFKEGPASFIAELMWANTDVYDFDGTLYFSAFTPVPAGNGLAAYQGVRLPKLPEWDKGAYPYAYLSDLDSVCRLTISTSRGYFDGTAIRANEAGNSVVFACTKSTGAWSEGTSNSFDADGYIVRGGTSVMWSNTDILTEDGETHLVAINPIPIYE